MVQVWYLIFTNNIANNDKTLDLILSLSHLIMSWQICRQDQKPNHHAKLMFYLMTLYATFVALTGEGGKDNLHYYICYLAVS